MLETNQPTIITSDYATQPAGGSTVTKPCSSPNVGTASQGAQSWNDSLPQGRDAVLATLDELRDLAIALAEGCSHHERTEQGEPEFIAALDKYFEHARSAVSRRLAELDLCLRAVYGSHRNAPLSPDAAAGFQRLTSAEQRVLAELAKGKANKILAYEFALTEAKMPTRPASRDAICTAP
jgi:DNA-binding NarL/FixJ family response regulator